MRRVPGHAKIRTNPAKIDVAPSAKNKNRNEYTARIPPIAGPKLMPRFTARRLSAKACLRCSGSTSSETSARLGGLTDSFKMANTNVTARIASKWRASGNKNSTNPERRSEQRITNRAPRRSVSRPAMGMVSSAAIPYTVSANAACDTEIASTRVRYSTRNGRTIVPQRFTSVAANSIQISRGSPRRPRQGFMRISSQTRPTRPCPFRRARLLLARRRDTRIGPAAQLPRA